MLPVQEQAQPWIKAGCCEAMAHDLGAVPSLENDRGERTGAARRWGESVQEVQQVTGERWEVAFVDQGYTGQEPAERAAREGVS